MSMAVEKGAKTAVVWLLFTLPLSLLEGGVLSERPAAVKGAPALRGEAETMAPTTTGTAKNTREAYPPTKIPASFKFEFQER